MIYLATAYSDRRPHVRQQRFFEVNLMTAVLIQRGHVVFSPISHSHTIAQFLEDQNTNWDFWKKQDLPMLEACSKLVIYAPDSAWEHSTGVQAELEHAELKGIPHVIVNESVRWEYLMRDKLTELGL
jgi:hypothetical protein